MSSAVVTSSVGCVVLTSDEAGDIVLVAEWASLREVIRGTVWSLQYASVCPLTWKCGVWMFRQATLPDSLHTLVAEIRLGGSPELTAADVAGLPKQGILTAVELSIIRVSSKAILCATTLHPRMTIPIVDSDEFPDLF